MLNNTHNPDVLLCLANLSNDEVFTSPETANAMLDMLPTDIWKDSTTTFIDPFTKTGVFLREITKRLIGGLEDQIPDLQERVNHILENQVFGIAITELTALAARRSLYCSKVANGEYSVCTGFDDEFGNILFDKTDHIWYNGLCKACGASEDTYSRGSGLETHAYQFIHTEMKRLFDMNFDVIVGNPPYQMKDGGAQASAKPIYHKFIEQAKALNPKYISMIVPARWYSGGKGLDSFRDDMLNDRRISQLHDIPIAGDVFPGVEIKGGVCYFLWDKDHNGDCVITNHKDNKSMSTSTRPLLEDGLNVLIRDNASVSILNKVNAFGEDSFSGMVSAAKAFGMRTYVKGEPKQFEGCVKLYQNGGVGYINNDQIVKNKEWTQQYKVLISEAYGAGDTIPHQILGQPIVSEPGSCCTETYLVLGPCDDKAKADNIRGYIATKFFRFLVSLIKNTQHGTKKVYNFVPMQDFNESWTDEKLYEKYSITTKEIEVIESMIKPMELKK